MSGLPGHCAGCGARVYLYAMVWRDHDNVHGRGHRCVVAEEPS